MALQKDSKRYKSSVGNIGIAKASSANYVSQSLQGLGQITSSAGATADGRDHWARCYSVLLGGGPIPAGQLFGASDTLGAYPARNPVSPGDIAATIYQAMGVDPQRRLRDPLNRPHTLAAGNPITPLLGG